jgi:hypothetical protein
MDTRRRGILAALLCSPAFLRAERIEQTTTVELPKEFTLKVISSGKTVTLSSEEIMDALQPLRIQSKPHDPFSSQN